MGNGQDFAVALTQFEYGHTPDAPANFTRASSVAVGAAQSPVHTPDSIVESGRKGLF